MLFEMALEFYLNLRGIKFPLYVLNRKKESWISCVMKVICHHHMLIWWISGTFYPAFEMHGIE